MGITNWFKRKPSDYQKRQSRSDFAANNPNYAAFNNIDADIAAIINSRRSVIDRGVEDANMKFANPTWQLYLNNDLAAMPLATNKKERIAQYRRISKYLICDWCLDEICDDFIHEDENKNFITLKLPQRLNAQQQDILQEEFKKYIGYFDLQDTGYNMIKRFLVEGELAWENIINPKYPKMGITGVRFLPAEYYETLVDVKSGQPVGIVFDVEDFSNETRMMYMSSMGNAAGIFNAIAPMTPCSFQFNKDTCIPLLWNQITYISSGEFSYDYMTTYPIIEKAKQQYHRLALLEDAAVILRVTHAPERLLFNISTGRMNQHDANEYAARFAQELKSKKVATVDGKDAFGVYSAPSMLKSYIFTKGDDNDGTSVESVGSSASYDEMADIEYFLRWFMKALKVPFSRYKTPENTMEKNDSISYEEYTFSRMIIRFQRRFAAGFKNGFITHLRLKGLMDKKGYELQDSDLNIEFVKPVLYDLYETQKLVTAKMDIYKAFKDTDFISQISIMKKYLGWTDDDIQKNFEMLIKEKQLVAVAEMFAEKVTAENPPLDFKSPLRLKDDVQAEQKAVGATEGKQEGEDDESAKGEDAGAADAGEAPGGEEEPEEATPQAEEASFGLG